MAPLTWRNVEDPDLSKASSILNQAVQNFSGGLSGLATNLTGVRDRQRRDRSAEAMPLLANIDSASNVDSILGQVSNMVDSRDMTPELQAAMLAARGEGLGYDQTRASTAATRDGNNRQQTTFDRNITREDQMAGLTPAWAEAQQGALWGEGGSIPNTPAAADIRQGLIDRGMPAHTAEGFVMNFVDESGLDPTAVGDGGNAFGLAQWNGDRMRGLQAYAESVGKPPSDVGVQLDFLMSELGSNEAGAWNQISAAPDARSAAAAVVNHFERPAEEHRARREAAYLGGQSELDLSQFLGDGNMLRPEDLSGLYQGVYDDQRTSITNQRADAEFGRSETARVQAETDAAANQALTEQAQGMVESMIPQLGPNDTAERWTEMVFGMEGISPELRDMLLPMGAAQIEARSALYSPNQDMSASSMIDATLSQIATNASLNDPMTEALKSAGVIQVPGQEAVMQLAPDGTEVPMDTSIEGQTQSVMGQLGTLLGGDQAAVNSSGAEILETVERVYDKYDGAIPREVIMGMVNNSLRGDSNNSVDFLGIPLWVDDGVGIRVDEEALTQSLSAIGTPEAYRKYVEDQRQSMLAAEDLNTQRDEYMAAQEDAVFFESSTAEGAEEKAAAARERMAEIDAVFAQAAQDDAYINGGGQAAAEADKADGKAASGEELASQTSEQRRDAILEGAAIPTADGTVVNPESSQIVQGFQGLRVAGEIDSSINKMRRDLEQQGGGMIAGTFGRIADLARSDADAGLAQANRAVASEVRDWLSSGDAESLFRTNPQLLYLAEQDPIAFYEMVQQDAVPENYRIPR